MKISFITCLVKGGMVGAVSCSVLFALCVAPTTTHAAGIQKLATTTSGLMGWWTLDEGTSTTAADFSGKGNTAAFGGTPLWVSGKRGRALSFDGSTTYVQAQGSATLNSPTNLTMSAWVKLAGSQPSPTGILTKEQGDCTNSAYAFEINGFTPNFVVESTGSVRDAVDGTALPIGQWKLITGVYDGSTAKMYVDGVLANTISHVQGIKSTAGTFQIGRQKMCSPVRFFNGSIDDVRVYNVAFSAAEVAALYKSGEVVRKSVDKTGLIAYWPLDEGTSTYAGDFSGRGLLGTLAGGATWTAGKKGSAISFNGTTGKVTAGSLNVPTTMSISAWIYKNSSTSQRSFFSNRGSGTVYFGLNGSQIFFYDNGGSPAGVSTGSIITMGQWQHLAATSDGSSLKFYLNGVLVQTFAQTRTGSVGTVGIGWDPNITTEFWDGKIDDVRVYGRVLSAAEVKGIYTQNQTKVNAPQNNELTNGLVGYWTFNGKDIGNTIVDVSGNGNDGYVQNGSATTSMLTIGKVGQGMSFNGTTSYLSAGAGPGAIATNQVSVAAWVYPNNTSSIMTVVSNDRDCCGSYKGFGMQIYYGGTSAFRIWDNAGAGPFGAGTATNPPAREWSHLVGTFDGSTIKYYMNGVLLSSSASVGNGILGTPSTFSTKIGQLGCCLNTHTMNGKIDEVRIYNRALTAAEAKQLYLMGK